MEDNVINSTIKFVKETLRNAESGHDWFHVERVWKNARKIAHMEKENNHPELNMLVVELAALLHDIADHKFHGGDVTVGGRVAGEFLKGFNLDQDVINAVTDIINKISFKGANSANEMEGIEGKIVQDADRLDAIGAIGIARVFSYGGYRNRLMYDPEDKPKLGMTWEEYKSNKGSCINHFYEKLLLIKDRMNTGAGKAMAEKRHKYMEGYLEQFYDEWD